MTKPNIDEEVDLLDLFSRMGNAISKGFKALGNAFISTIIFFLRHSMLLILSIIIGIGLTYGLKWSTKPVYRSEMTLRSNAAPNAEMIAFVNRLKILIKERNLDAIEKALSISREEALTLKEIEAFWIIDKNRDGVPDKVDYRNNHNIYDTLDVRMNDRFVVRAKFSSPSDLPKLKTGLISYISNDQIFKIRNEFRLRSTDELLERLNYDIDQLDSLQKIKYYEETKNLREKTGGQIVFLQEQKTQLVYEDIYNLYSRKQLLDEEKAVYPDVVTVMSDFYIPARRFNGGFYFGKFIIPLCFIIMLKMILIFRYRKRLTEIYRKN